MAEFLCKRAFLLHLLPDLLDVVEVVGEGCVDVGKSDGRELGEISSGVMPWCSCHTTTSSTRMRWPAVQALPPQTPGVRLIRPSMEMDMTQL